MDAVLELRALSKHYPTHRAVDGVSFSIDHGEFFALVGPSGCGKTTTLRLVGGFEEPTAGDILLAGRSVTNLPPFRRNVSTVFQSYALFPHLSVAKNVAFGLERRSEPRGEIERKVAEVLNLVHLKGKEQRLPHKLSGGERQRAALARSLVLAPDILLLDEPLSALDPKLRKQVRAELKSLQRRTGIAFLFVTHDQEEALSLSDRMAVMHEGKICQLGRPRELYDRPQSRFVAEFLGLVNWVNGSAIRPEALRISAEHPGVQFPSYPGVIEDTTFLGNVVHVDTRLATGEKCIAELSQRSCLFQQGQEVHLWWNPADELQVSNHN